MVASNDESSDSCVEVQTPIAKPPKRRGRQDPPRSSPGFSESVKKSTCKENINLCDLNRTKTYNQVILSEFPTFDRNIPLQLTKPKLK